MTIDKFIGVKTQVSYERALSYTNHHTLWMDVKDELNWKAKVHGLRILDFVTRNNDCEPLMLEHLIVARCNQLPPSVGYDSEGRECWEYP
jgi:hypothetical protein